MTQTKKQNNFKLACSTLRSFKRRGDRATHNSKYRGNWSPDVVRNLLLRYSKKGDNILDPMIGGGTTAIECKLLDRNLIAYDINPDAIKHTNELLDFEADSSPEITIKLHDATAQDESIKNESIDFILMHPPYADIIKYSEGKIDGDLSNIHEIDDFCDEIEKVAQQAWRVLKPGKYCAILMGDTRREKMYQPLAFSVMQRFLKTGFALKEDIIKVQHNCKATGFWAKRSKEYNFLLIKHEHLFVFKKPENNKDMQESLSRGEIYN